LRLALEKSERLQGLVNQQAGGRGPVVAAAGTAQGEKKRQDVMAITAEPGRLPVTVMVRG